MLFRLKTGSYKNLGDIYGIINATLNNVYWHYMTNKGNEIWIHLYSLLYLKQFRKHIWSPVEITENVVDA